MTHGGKSVSFEDFVRRASGEKSFHRPSLFTPSLLYPLFRDPFWLWCEYHAPKEEAVYESSRYERMRLQRGQEFEAEWVRKNYPDALRIEAQSGFESLRRTLEAMVEGARTIHGGELWDLKRESYGKADLIIRDDRSPSDLGPFHYRLLQIERSWSSQDLHVLKAAFINRMLGEIQGYIPEEITIGLKGASEHVSYSSRESELDAALAKWMSLFRGDAIPEPGRPPRITASPWRTYGKKIIEQGKDLVLLAGVHWGEREKLRAAGISSVDRLWQLDLKEVSEILGDEAGARAYFVAGAYRQGGPIAKPGCRLEIPRGKRLLYIDFETSDDVHPKEPPHIYLIGCWDAMRDQYVFFLAHGAEDEERIFRDFLDYVGDLKDTRLYHWTDFEIQQMRSVGRRWPGLEGELAALIPCCVDLKEAIQAAVYLPVPTFSLKSVAPALGFSWRQEEIGAYEAMVCYWDYLDGGDRSTVEKAILYNEDDCRAMWHIDQELKHRLK